MKLVLQILLILLIVATFSICAIQPEMHKNIIVYDSAYTLVSEQEVTTEKKDIPVMEMPSKPVEKTTVVEKRVEPKVKTYKTELPVVKTQTVTKPKQTFTQKQTVTQPQVQTTVAPQKTTVQKPVLKETVKVVQPKIEKKVVEQLPLENKVKVLTQQEETIAWNKWRSALTNKIMQDTRLPNIPNGTVFQFSFNVDKYGKITNVQTGANPANYTPYAIQYIAPVIRSYQGKSILNFPEGTQRASTQVTGKWRISTSEKYSTPQDYNDIERIVR